ncbi:hypothetical protein F4779DRAFT_592815 [Xylariaceae sp. FL0662B]|nr:hypothetical protein F4779DRAFT_592815 [Xylariaceae sp. FL0662B]
MAPRKAIYLSPSGDLQVITQTKAYIPTGSQFLVHVKYSAINPADIRHFHMGWHSFVAGYEWIGTVEAVGPTSPFRPGEAVFGFAKPGHQRPISVGAHQDYLLTEPWMTYRLPDPELDWTQVVAWPIGLHTSIDALFNVSGFSFPPLRGQGVDGEDPTGRAILIWGGSSTVGLSAIQLARAAGFAPIFTTASARNHRTLLELGATQCFDYRDPSVVDKIRAAVSQSGKELSVIFDAVTTGVPFANPLTDKPLDPSKSSPAIAKRCLTDGARDVRLSSTLLVEDDPDWKFCIAVRDEKEFPDYSRHITAIMNWVLDNHKAVAFNIPNVRVVAGAEDGIQAIRDVFAGKVSMEKVVIQHPL